MGKKCFVFSKGKKYFVSVKSSNKSINNNNKDVVRPSYPSQSPPLPPIGIIFSSPKTE